MRQSTPPAAVRLFRYPPSFYWRPSSPAQRVSGVSTYPRRTSPRFLQAVIALVDAFREALEMRRAAHKSHPFHDQ
jgi:hypothetical protein